LKLKRALTGQELPHPNELWHLNVCEYNQIKFDITIIKLMLILFKYWSEKKKRSENST